MTSLRLRRVMAPAVLAGLLVLAVTNAVANPPAHAKPATDGSGGRAVAHRAGGQRITTPSITSDAPDAKQYPVIIGGTQIRSGEPTLGFTKSGDLFYSAFQSNTRVDVAHSGDYGKTWDLRSPQIAGRNVQLVSLDPYVWVDPYTDRIFTIDLTVACSYMSFSDDLGKTWITNPLACGRPVNDHQTLASGPPVSTPMTPLYENIVYYCWNDIASSACSKSIDGGLTFHPTGTPAYPGVDPEGGGQGEPGFCGGLHGHVHVGPDGTVYLPKEHCGRPFVSISKDEGLTWTRVRVAKNGPAGGGANGDPSVATDKKGNVYYMWLGSDRLPYLAVSKNGGLKWSEPMMIGAPGLKEANLPSVWATGDGKVAWTYYGSTNSQFDYRKQDCEDCKAPDYTNTTWNGYMGMTTDAFAKNPIFYTGTVNDPSDPLVRGTCGPGRCPAVVDFIDATIAPNGTVWGAFTDGCIGLCGASGGLGGPALVGSLEGGPKLK